MTNSKKNGKGCAVVGAGCGTVLVICLVVLAVVGYFGFKLVKGSYSGLKELTDIALIENEVINQSEYVPPEDGLMSLEQVESLVYIQTEIKDAMGPEFEVLSEKHENLMEELEQMSDFAKVRKLFSISRQLVNPLGSAKRAQIEAINREGISMSEYKWLKHQAMTSLGIPERKLDIREILESATGESIGEPSEDSNQELVVHPENKQMLQPHAVVLTETFMLSAIGI